MPDYTFSDLSSGSQNAANGETLTAEQAQDNPVGITEKYIYIIRNYINSKVYIGQAVDPQKRFDGHIHNSMARSERSAIDSAIKKYGAENFYYEILEEKTADYNESEKYWIRFFNSISPNGYNILAGGEDPPVRRGIENNRSKFSKADIPQIHRLLRNPAVTIMDIASAYGVSPNTIKNVNNGRTHRMDKIQYPIRDFRCSGEHGNMLSSNTINAIICDLLFTDLSMRKIALKYRANDTQVKEINDGSVAAYKRGWMIYPLRESSRVSKEKASKIQKQLLEGILSKQQIAHQNGVSYSVVSNINSGRCFLNENLVYPLKKHEGRYDYEESLWENVRSMLKDGASAKAIAAKLHLPNTSMVHDINTGKTHRSDQYAYPIQPYQPKISDELIRELAKDVKYTRKTLAQIAKEYGVHKSTVLNVKNGKYQRYRVPGYTYPLR